MSCYCEKCKASRLRWNANNRDKVNAQKRARRLQKLNEIIVGRCIRCDVLIRKNVERRKKFCKDCSTRFTRAINRYKCRRYYQQKKQAV